MPKLLIKSIDPRLARRWKTTLYENGEKYSEFVDLKQTGIHGEIIIGTIKGNDQKKEIAFQYLPAGFSLMIERQPGSPDVSHWQSGNIWIDGKE